MNRTHGHDRIADEIHRVHLELASINDTLKTLSHPQSNALNGFIAAIYGRSVKMPVNVPVPQLLDTEKILLSVMPRKADGHVDTAAVVSWASSDGTQVGINVGTDTFVFHDPQFDEDVTCPGAFNCEALTPGTSGAATVTASAPGYDSAEFGPITYAPGVPRSLNASIGSPVSDL